VNKTIYSRQSHCLCEWLVKLRRAAGLTQRQLAAKLNRERNLIGRLEVGERRLDIVEFYWICKACGVKPDDMAGKLMRDLEEVQSPSR
jgi:transcriptional regulator with XRE-family HTH domain